MRLLPCPWQPAPADCWETSSTSVKAVMRRKLVDHYEIDTGGLFEFKGGFSIMEDVADGALYEGINDDSFEIELDLEDEDIATAGLSFGATLMLLALASIF